MSKLKPYIIGVSGGSGVGKSVLSKVLSRYFGMEKSLILSTDDLHKWERNDPAWNYITHLNPEANNLKLGLTQLESLKNWKSIERKLYDHSTGKHTKLKLIKPKEFIIHEGLHAFYGKGLSKLCDFKIFIETTDSLKRHWKIVRDIKKRGYTPNQVKESIDKRAADYEKFLLYQKKDADLIIFLSESKKIKKIGDPLEIIKIKTKIFLDSDRQNDSFSSSLINFLKKDLSELRNFITYSKIVGMDESLVTDSGGNTSLKTSSGKILIKASGCSLKNMSYLEGYLNTSLDDFKHKFSDLFSRKNSNKEKELYEILKVDSQFASMESGFHILMNNKAIIHTHPIYVNVLLCVKSTKEILSKIYPNIEYTLIEQVSPGFKLLESMRNKKTMKNIVFLKNHGLIVGEDSMLKAFKITQKLNDEAFNFLNSFEGFVSYDKFVYEENNKLSNHLFPDSIALNNPKKHLSTFKAAQYIFSISKLIDQPDFLNKDLVNYILNLQIEKDRGNK